MCRRARSARPPASAGATCWRIRDTDVLVGRGGFETRPYVLRRAFVLVDCHRSLDGRRRPYPLTRPRPPLAASAGLSPKRARARGGGSPSPLGEGRI